MYNDEHNLYHYTYREDGSEAEAHPLPSPARYRTITAGRSSPCRR